MTNKRQLVESLEVAIKLLQEATREREEELRSLLYVKEVDDVEDLEESKDYILGYDLVSQIDDLKDYVEDLTKMAVRIGAFKNV